MTDSLRMRVVEAMAEAWKEARQSPIVNIAAAEAALDAMLDCLAENENKFEPASFRMVVADLVRLLREDR